MNLEERYNLIFEKLASGVEIHSLELNEKSFLFHYLGSEWRERILMDLNDYHQI